MGITLTSKTINSTYDSLLKLTDNDSLTSAFKIITDGLGNDTGISINNAGNVNISGTLVVNTKIQTPLLQLTGGTGTQGEMSWNTDEETVDVVLNGSTLQLGQEVHVHVRNNSVTTAIPNGTPVYVTGTLGASGRLKVAPMIADGTISAEYFIGVTTEEIGADEDGKVTWFGKVRGFDTSGYTEGSKLYVSETVAGGWQTTEPTAPNPKLEVAFTVNQKSNGAIFVRGGNGQYLHDNHDVKITSVADKDLLVYDSTNGIWKNSKTLGNVTTDYITAKGISLGGVATPEITFNGTSDTGIDMAITATPEGLDFYEPEQGNKIHFQILDDLGVNSLYGYKVAGSDFVDASRNITAGTISSGNITTSGKLSGPNVFYIDPSPTDVYGDGTYGEGKVVIQGDLEVTGQTTTVNSTEVTINDKNLLLGYIDVVKSFDTVSTSTTLTLNTGDLSGVVAGMGITGSGIPADTTVVSITDDTDIEISNAATATATGVSMTFAMTSSMADGAGITIGGADATLTYDSATDNFISNKDLTIVRPISSNGIYYPLSLEATDVGNLLNQEQGDGVGVQFKLANNETAGGSFLGGAIAAVRENASDADSSTSLEFYTSNNDETLDKRLTILSNGTVSATTFSGALSGNVTGNLTGTASNADKLDNLNSTQFLRSDAEDYTSQNLGVRQSDPIAALDVFGTTSASYPTAYNYLYATDAGIRVYGNESSIDIVGNDIGDHGTSILLRTANNGYGFINNPNGDCLQLRYFVATADAFAIHGTATGATTTDLMTINQDGDISIDTGDLTVTGDISGSALSATTGSFSGNIKITTSNVGIDTVYGIFGIEATDAQIDLISSSDGTWGSALNFVEGTDSTANTDIWSIARQTTGGSGDSSLNFNFGTTNQHDNTAKVTITTDAFVGINNATPSYPIHIGDNTFTTDAEIAMETSVGKWSIFSDNGSDLFGIYKYGTGGGRKFVLDSNGYATFSNNAGTTNASITISNTDTGIDINQSVGYINFYSNDGSTTSTGGVGGIALKAETAFNTSYTPTYLSFYTHQNTANDGSTLGNVTERMRIDSNGHLDVFNGEIRMQENHFINKRFDIADNANGVQYVLLCVYAGANDVNGTITMDRTSGLRHACSVDIIVSAGSSDLPVGGLRSMGTAEGGNPSYKLVTCDYNTVTYVALEITNPDNYYESSGAYFTGRLVSTGESLLPKLASEISNIADFEANTQHNFDGEVNLNQGGFYMAGSQVISSARNITNVGTVTATSSMTAPTFYGDLDGNAETATTATTAGSATVAGAANYATTAGDTDTVDSLHASQFLRSDESDSLVDSSSGDVSLTIQNTFDDNQETSTPTATLWVNAASNNGYLRCYGAPTDLASAHNTQLGTTAGGGFLTFLTGGYERMRILSGGDIQFTGDRYIYSNTTSGSGTVSAGFNLQASANTIKAYTSGTERFHIDTSYTWTNNNFGLDITNPQTKLEIGNAAGSVKTTAISVGGGGSVTTGGGQAIFLKASGNNDLDRYGVKISSERNASNNGAADFVIEQEPTALGGMQENFRITANGEFGMRKSSLSGTNRLEILATGNYDLATGGNDTGGILINGGATTGSGNYTGGIGFGFGTGTVGLAGVQESADSDYLGMAFFTHPTGTGNAASEEKMRLGAAGGLKIKGGDSINALIITDSGDGNGFKVTSHSTQGTYIQAYNASHTQTIMLDARTDSSGRDCYFNMGGDFAVGHTSPLAKFHSYDNSGEQGMFSGWSYVGGNVASGAIRLGNNASYQGQIDYAADGNTEFKFNNSYASGIYTINIADSEKVRIASDGKMGLLNTNPQTNLHIGNGTAAGVGIALSGANSSGRSSYIAFGDSTSGTAPYYNGISIYYNSNANTLNFHNEYTGDFNLMEIERDTGTVKIPNNLAVDVETLYVDGTNNRVGIGDSTPSYKLDVAGDIRATGDVIAYSDVRVKENIETIPNALDSVKEMRGVLFNKIGEEKQSTGVIAQEIEKILPQVVSEDDNGMKSVAYGNIVGVLIEAIKEQQQQIDELKAKLDGVTK